MKRKIFFTGLILIASTNMYGKDTAMIEKQLRLKLKRLSEGVERYLENLKEEKEVANVEKIYDEMVDYVMKPGHADYTPTLPSGPAGYIIPILDDFDMALKLIEQLNPTATNDFVDALMLTAAELDRGIMPNVPAIIEISDDFNDTLVLFRQRANFEPPYLVLLVKRLVNQLQQQILPTHGMGARALAAAMKNAAEKLQRRLYEITNKIPVKGYPYYQPINLIWQRAHIMAYPGQTPVGPTVMWFADRLVNV